MALWQHSYVIQTVTPGLHPRASTHIGSIITQSFAICASECEMRTLDPVSQLLLIDFEGGHPQIGLANQIPQRIEVFGPHFSNDHHDTR